MSNQVRTRSGGLVIFFAAAVVLGLFFASGKNNTITDNRPKQRITFSVTFDPEFIKAPASISIKLDDQPFHTATNKSGKWAKTFEIPEGSTVILTAVQDRTSNFSCLISDENGNILDDNDIFGDEVFERTGELVCKAVI